MIQSDRTDDRAGTFGRFDNVRGIERSAHSDLQNHKITLFLEKIQHGGGGDDLEFGRRVVGNGIGGGKDGLHNMNQLIVRDVLPVDLHTLVKNRNVGRGVKPDAKSAFAQNRRDHGTGRAFAVRARNVNEFQRFLRVAECAEKAARARKSRLCAEPFGFVDIRKCLFNVHFLTTPRSEKYG